MGSSTGLRASPPTKIEVDLPPGRDAPAQARRVLDRLDGLDDATREDARLVVSELVGNSVRHADLRPDDHIRLEVEDGSDAVRIRVVDPGPGFEPEVLAGPSLRASQWGLFLVDRIASEWGVASEGTTAVWCEIDRRS
ncbi:MAG TPA: ATP-binding protein [Actinomycetota bacterium]|nr:ATP-binding protein [Actinomycetota bacterium]